MPGFGALGELALGEGRATVATPKPLVFTKFSEPSLIKKVLPNQYTEPRFEVEPPKYFNPPTTGPLVFTSFPNQVLTKNVSVNTQTEVRFTVFPLPAATPKFL